MVLFPRLSWLSSPMSSGYWLRHRHPGSWRPTLRRPPFSPHRPQNFHYFHEMPHLNTVAHHAFSMPVLSASCRHVEAQVGVHGNAASYIDAWNVGCPCETRDFHVKSPGRKRRLLSELPAAAEIPRCYHFCPPLLGVSAIPRPTHGLPPKGRAFSKPFPEFQDLSRDVMTPDHVFGEALGLHKVTAE